MTAASASSVLSIDFETASQCDLKRAGAYVYSEHPTTQVLCMAYAFDNGPVQIWRRGQPFPRDVLDHVRNSGEVRAWNASFEWNVWNNTLLRQLGVGGAPNRLTLYQLHDTMAAAAYYGLPLSLDMAASAAHISIPKDKEGHSLMLRMCRPRKVNPDGTAEWWHETDPEKFARLCAYCQTDVAAERELAASLPALPPDERRTWVLDQQINARGVGVDTNLVLRLKDLALGAAGQGNRELSVLTGGKVNSVNAHAALLEFVRAHGYPEDNLRRATVEARLDEPGCTGIERMALDLRADIARTSAAKLDAMLACSGKAENGVAPVRGMLQYYGAFRTGRWAGRLIQLQNMPRGVIGKGEVGSAIETILNTAAVSALLTVLPMLYGPVMGVVSSLLRGCIVPRRGRKLVVADFSQIEARVLPWLAGQLDVLDAFRRGEDIYKLAAARIFGVPADAVTSDQRQIGKVAILALGYGGGVGAFQTMATAYGVTISDVDADTIKAAWRDANPHIVSFWWALDTAARSVIQSGGMVDVGPLKIGMWNRHMVIRLPSGRSLIYRDARIVTNPDNGREEVSYMGLNQYTRKWERLRTYGGKLAENVTQAVARDCMRDVMLEADRLGVEILLTVHDELINEADDAGADAALQTVLGLMATPPAWAASLPVKGDGFVTDRYRK